MDFQQYLTELKEHLEAQDDIQEVTLTPMDDRDITRVHVKCKPGHSYASATYFLHNRDVAHYQSLADSNDVAIILTAIRPTPQQQEASVAAQRDVDAYLDAVGWSA